MTPQQEPAAAVTSTKQSLLDKIAEQQAEVASRYQPVMDIDDAGHRYDQLKAYIEKRLFEGEDYGRIPGVEKPFLFKSGAQKLCMLFGYVPHYEALTEIEDWTGQLHGEALFYYKYSCVLSKNGQQVGEGIGSCNSWESKYRYRWVPEDVASQREDFDRLPKRGGTKTMFEPEFAIDKAETTGKYGKPAEYWQRWEAAIQDGTAKAGKKMMGKREFVGYFLTMDETQYRIPNDGFPDVINTCQKQGEKRSYVEATLSATGASQFFSQDEDAVQMMPDAGRQNDAPSNGKPETPANLPPELQAIFVTKPEPGAVGRAFELVKRALLEVLPENGAEEYQRILEHNGLKPGKGNPLGPSRNAVMQCWTQAQGLKRLQKKPEPQDMSDMPHAADRSEPSDDIAF